MWWGRRSSAWRCMQLRRPRRAYSCSLSSLVLSALRPGAMMLESSPKKLHMQARAWACCASTTPSCGREGCQHDTRASAQTRHVQRGMPASCLRHAAAGAARQEHTPSLGPAAAQQRRCLARRPTASPECPPAAAKAGTRCARACSGACTAQQRGLAPLLAASPAPQSTPAGAHTAGLPAGAATAPRGCTWRAWAAWLCTRAPRSLRRARGGASTVAIRKLLGQGPCGPPCRPTAGGDSTHPARHAC